MSEEQQAVIRAARVFTAAHRAFESHISDCETCGKSPAGYYSGKCALGMHAGMQLNVYMLSVVVKTEALIRSEGHDLKNINRNEPAIEANNGGTT